MGYRSRLSLFLLLPLMWAVAGCSGRDFGWTSDVWGNPYPPDPQEMEARFGEMQALRASAETVRLSWKQHDELVRLCGMYEELLAYSQGRVKDQLETYYQGLSLAERKQVGPPGVQPGEAPETFRARANQRFSRLQELAELPFNPDLYNDFWKLSRSYYLLAEQLDQEEEVEEKLALYQQGLDSAERAMHCFPEFRAAIKAGEAEEVAVKQIPREGIAGVYWTTVNLSKWSRIKGFSYILFNKNKGWEMIQHVRGLDETWYYGAADRYLGAFYAVAPSIAGGDMALSWKHFQASLQAAPYYLATSVLIAEYYATKMQNRELFRERVQFVLDAPLDIYADILPLQRLEQEKARHMLTNIDEYF